MHKKSDRNKKHILRYWPFVALRYFSILRTDKIGVVQTIGSSAVNSIGSLRILILENSPRISLDLRATLETLGCKIIESLDQLGCNTSTPVEEREVDVAIVDLLLANGSSDDIIRAFDKRGVPVIICSGLMRRAVRAEYPNAEVLGRPYRLDELRAALNRALLHRSTLNSEELHSL